MGVPDIRLSCLRQSVCLFRRSATFRDISLLAYQFGDGLLFLHPLYSVNTWRSFVLWPTRRIYGSPVIVRSDPPTLRSYTPYLGLAKHTAEERLSPRHLRCSYLADDSNRPLSYLRPLSSIKRIDGCSWLRPYSFSRPSTPATAPA